MALLLFETQLQNSFTSHSRALKVERQRLVSPHIDSVVDDVIQHRIEGSHHFSFRVHLCHCKYFPDLVNKYVPRLGVRLECKNFVLNVISEICFPFRFWLLLFHIDSQVRQGNMFPFRGSVLTQQISFQVCRWNMVLASGFHIDATDSISSLPLEYDPRVGFPY